MNRFSLTAVNAEDLLTQLAAADITVPLRTEGRTTEHCERYVMAHLLSTLASLGALEFPLALKHQDRPDFILSWPGREIGIECTEAVSEVWAHIDVIRERDYPDSLIMPPILTPGKNSFTRAERESIASGVKAGPPWCGSMAVRQWADAMAHFVERKTDKLRAGNYGCGEHWLLIQDEWRVPIYHIADLKRAAELCISKSQSSMAAPSFSRIYVSSGLHLLQLIPAPPAIVQIHNVWS